MKRWKDKQEFKVRVLDWAGRFDVKVRSLSVRPMSNKWASCSTAGNLNFNAELLGMDRAVGDYVIVHELLHFSVPHHGKLWKSLMRAHLGDYNCLFTELRLVNLARASLDELLLDYEDFLRQRRLPAWNKDDPEAREVRTVGATRARADRSDPTDPADHRKNDSHWLEHSHPAVVANAGQA